MSWFEIIVIVCLVIIIFQLEMFRYEFHLDRITNILTDIAKFVERRR